MSKLSFFDQMNRVVTINFPVKRIISLVPSQTELLSDLGLDSAVVGITKYCIHPVAWTDPKTIVGGTKNFNIDTIAVLKPDLIIGNKEENDKEGIEQLQEKHPVWMSDIVTYADALSMMSSIGDITDRKVEVDKIIKDIEEAFHSLRTFLNQSVLYLIWRKPWMAAGKNTFVNTMLEKMNLRNALPQSRYPQLTSEDIKVLNPQYIFLSSEPFPFEEKHTEELQLLCPDSKIVLVDGEMFSWYGSRLQYAPAYLNSLKLP